jgi:hypothetical protein
MTFFNPWAFGFAGLVPVIVALYLLKVRRRPVAISTLMFWQRVLQENQRRALFQRLRQWLSLLLHLLIFALVMLALSRPTIDRAVHEGSSTVLILDTRARMQARESDGATRMEKAMRAALTYARQAGPFRQMAVQTSAGHGGVRLGFSADEKALRESIQACAASDAGGDLQPAIRLAADLLASRAGEKRIVVFSDRAEPPAQPAPLPIQTVTVGSARDNVAILHFATRALPASPETFEILAEVANFSARPWNGNLEVSLDGRLLDVRPFALAPGERKTAVFPTVVEKPGGGQLTAKLSADDALPLDNVAYALLAREPIRKVLLVTQGNWFLEKLLAADVRLRFELLAPDAYQPAMAANFDAVILDDQPAPALPESGNFLYLKQSPFATGGPALEQPIVTEADAQHPALRLASLEHVSFARAVEMAIPRQPGSWKFEAPLRFGDQPLLIVGERGAAGSHQRLAALAFGLTDSDLPLRVAFPLLMANTIHWLAGGGAEAQDDETIRPSDNERNGFYEVRASDGSAQWRAVNTFDERESDLRLATGEAAAASALQAPRVVLGGWPLWPWLALAAALLFTGEWWLFHRRQTE